MTIKNLKKGNPSDKSINGGKNGDSQKLSENSFNTLAVGGDEESLFETQGYVHSLETLGALDGPGIRTVVFLSGCPMRCAYCHNPDTFFPDKGKLIGAKEVADFCFRYKEYYGGNGGVTLSGGEPLMQAEFCLKVIGHLKRQNIHVCLDTAGSIFAPQTLKMCDIVILDIKHTDPQRFFELTGYKMDNTLKTLEFLKQSKIPFIVRQVIYEGYTDNAEQVAALRNLAEGAKKIELLPFHNMGAYKWENLGIEYRAKNAMPPSKEKMDELNKILMRKK